MAYKHTRKDWQITKLVVGDEVRQNPTWDQVQTAIQSLDASQRRSALVIEAADESVLVIGGGHGRLTVQLTYPPSAQQEILVLADPSRGTELEDLIVDGIKSPLPARFIVDQVKATRAAQRFYQEGVAPSELTWETG